ncbi:hypothetical protein ACFXD5_31440 [Streptomyces sp. NPDC059385]|uniref:hypothetical protein n=1 Tax=Streptomyces sp. NPDC059385 TaxID=3346817 RepID=UPI0036B83664
MTGIGGRIVTLSARDGWPIRSTVTALPALFRTRTVSANALPSGAGSSGSM